MQTVIAALVGFWKTHHVTALIVALCTAVYFYSQGDTGAAVGWVLAGIGYNLPGNPLLGRLMGVAGQSTKNGPR